MFRRSRFSIRPNVGTAGRAATAATAAVAASPQEAPPVNKEAAEAPKDAAESSTAQPQKAPAEKPTVPGDGNDPNGEGTSTSAAVQRRKRFSIKPKVAPGRPSALARTPKSPVKAISETPVEVSGSDLDPAAVPRGLQSPRRRRPSENSKLPAAQPGTTVSHVSSAPAAAPPDDSAKQTSPSADGGKKSERQESQVKELPKVPPSLPDKEVVEISEKAKTLLSSRSEPSKPTSKFSLCRLLNDPSDVQRLEKARKLRQLLKQELHKEKKFKAKSRAKEYSLDPSKMTMRDLIRYLPVSNPMPSSTEDQTQENETIIPSSPAREQSPERAQEPEPDVVASPRQEAEEDEEVEQEDEEDALMVPQVKVAEDGSLIIDEESLTVEVQRAKGPNTVQDRDPIFERGSTTTYSSFRKGIHSKPWSPEETDMFFLAISMVGTDFSMICQLFPHRARLEIKNKFKKEERENAWRVDKAFRERRKLDIEYFTKLLQKILEVQKSRKKLKSLSEKNSPKKRQRKTKGTKRKKASNKLSDVEEEDEENENELPNLEGEKENEDLGNEGGATASKPRRKRAKPCEEDTSKEETKAKTNKGDGDCISDDTEAAVEDQSKSDTSKSTARGSTIKPAKLLRGRPPKRLVSLGKRWGTKPLQTDAEDEEEQNIEDLALNEQVNKEELPSIQASEKKVASDVSSEDEDYNIQPSKPTRYGRIPKPPKPLNYPAKEDTHSSASEAALASPTRPATSNTKPKTKKRRVATHKEAQESKRPKLITLKASQSEHSDDEDDNEREEDMLMGQWPGGGSSKDSSASAFVPVSLRSPDVEICEVDETMEELDILATMPDVLGISQDALCPDASCERAQNETGTAEPCEHQLDLLVDVIDFLSSEQTGVSEAESYNEAAHTLLTIGNMAHLSQSATQQTGSQDPQTECMNEASQPLEEEIEQKLLGQGSSSAMAFLSPSAAVVQEGAFEATMEPQSNTTDKERLSQTDDTAVDSGRDQMFSEQSTVPEIEPTPQLPSNQEKSPPQSRRGRLPKVKPRPNLDRTTRAGQSRSRSDADPSRATVESQAATTDIAADSQSSSVSGDQFSLEQPTTVARSHVQKDESDNNPSTSDIGVIESEAKQGSNANNSATIQESSSRCDANANAKAAEEVTPAGEPSDQTKKSRFSKVKPRPNLPQTSRNAQSKRPTARGSVEKDTNPSSDLEEAKTQTPSTFLAEKLTLSSTPSATLASADIPKGLSSTEETQTHVVGVHLDATKDSRHSPNLVDSNFGPTSEPKSTDKVIESQPACSSSTSEKHPSIDSEKASSTEEIKPDAGSQLDSETLVPNAAQRRRRFPKAKPNLGSPARKIQPNLQPSDSRGSSSSNVTSGQKPVDDNRMQIEPNLEASTSEDCSTKVKSSSTELDNAQEPCLKNVSEILNQDMEKQSTENSQTPTDQSQIPQCTNDSPSEPSNPSTSSTKPLESHMGKLHRSEPNLGPGVPPQQTRQVQTTAHADTGSTAFSTEQSQIPVNAQLTQLGIQKPVEEVVKRVPPPHIDAGSSVGHVAQAPELSTQDLIASSAGETQSFENLTIFQDMLSAPSDPDEPFFILSLTEIPICPSGEVADSVPEPLPYLATADASAQQQRIVSGSGLAAGGDGPPPIVLEPAPMEAITVKDSVPSSVRTHPVYPNESATVNPPDSLERSVEVDDPPPKKKPGTAKRGKPRVMPCITGTRPAPETLADSTGACDDAAADKGAQSEGRSLEESSSSTQVASRTNTMARKPKGFLSFLSSSSSSNDAPRGKAASRGPSARAPQSARRRSTREPAASLSHTLSVAPTVSPARTPVQTPSNPSPPSSKQTGADVAQSSTSQFTPEVAVSQGSAASSTTEEEPMSVSQYFLSDIFTDVEEG